ncbi:MAG: PP2C family protein-serine/threonine phosphatase [Actinomycetota bacterium]|nr:PP2C family protein-serine/threonine phosphatase [Actinomycetota bacterium]
MERLVPAVAAVVCAVAAVVWARATVGRRRVAGRLTAEIADPDLWRLAWAEYRRDFQSAVGALGSGTVLVLVWLLDVPPLLRLVSGVLAVPSLLTIVRRRNLAEVARIAASRSELDQRAREVLTQEELAPLQWPARLAPSELPAFPGLEIGRAYQPGSGALAGDFYDVFRIDGDRVAAVIGDVTGHGIEPSITALQAKYLLRAFLLQYRDPGQALENLNAQMSVIERGDEFLSLVVLVFDNEAETLRYASAGHPAAFVWHGREVRPLGATGPLLMLDPTAPYHSREISWDVDDVAVLYTDGLSEARRGDALFGEDGVAGMIRRDPTAAPDVLTKVLVEAARDFAGGPIDDDVAVLVLRRV